MTKATPQILEGEDCVHKIFEARARRSPEAIAAMFGDEQLRYQELDRRTNQLAHYLRSRGVGPEVLVSLYVDRSLDMLVGILGILKAGGGYVPIDPDYPQERVRFMHETARARLVLTHARLLERLPNTGLPAVALDAARDVVAASPAHAPADSARPDNLAYVIFTSGSTGRPKGVQIAHRAVVNLLRSMAREPALGPDDVLLAVTTLSFDISNLELLLPLVVGARVVIADRATAIDGAQLLARLATTGATAMQATPSTFRLLLAAGWDASTPFRALCGGEALPAPLARALVARSVEVWNLYGPTETTIWSSVWRVPADDGPVSIGHPIDHTVIHVLDEALRPVPMGELGELCIGGAGVARGYLENPALTAEHFVPDPFSDAPGARMYRTGDHGRTLPDGTLQCLGRIDQQLKIRGYRIEPGEIAAVLEEHPGVAQAVVVAHEPRPEDRQLVAYFVPRGERSAAAELRQHLKDRLPAYMIPERFIALRAIPLLPNGKVDRASLPAPGEYHHVRSGDREPSTPAERALAAIWSQVLSVPSVSAKDNFLALGGSSFTGLKVVSLARDRGLRLSVTQIVGDLDLAQLATAAAEVQRSPTEPASVHPDVLERAVPQETPRRVPLTVGQRMDLPETDRLDPRSPELTTLLIFESPHPIDLERAEAAMRSVAAHHEALRLRFRRTLPGEDGDPALGAPCGWTQTIAETDEARYVVRLDPSRHPAAPDETTDETTAVQRAIDELYGGINLSHGPLVQLGILERASRHHLVVLICSLASDGYSDHIIVEDFQLAYGQLTQGRAVALPCVGTPLSRWCERLCRPCDLPEETLARLRAWTPAPAGVARPRARDSFSMVAAEPPEMRALGQLALRAHGMRLDEVLLAALAHTIASRTKDREIPIARMLHGRTPHDPDVDLSRTAGSLAFSQICWLTVPEHAAPWASARAIVDQLRKAGGAVDAASLSVQRFYNQSPRVRERLAQLHQEAVLFHFHPDALMSDRPDAVPLTLDLEAMSHWGPQRDEPGPLSEEELLHRPRLNLIVIGGTSHFMCAFTFDASCYSQDNIDQLAQSYLRFLRSLLAHEAA